MNLCFSFIMIFVFFSNIFVTKIYAVVAKKKSQRQQKTFRSLGILYFSFLLLWYNIYVILYYSIILFYLFFIFYFLFFLKFYIFLFVYSFINLSLNNKYFDSHI